MAAFGDGMAAKGIHLINDDGALLPEKDINEFLVAALGGETVSDVFHRTGMNYHVVGIFGGQSSGKSTLLNCLFRTGFETMDGSRRRGQTTKGAFMTRAILDEDAQVDNGEGGGAADALAGGGSLPLFVLDFEGTDGIERGEDQNFERQLSLFALSVADVLIVNMWAVDVGRFNAANMSLLRTVFEVNLQLFSNGSYVKEEKPTLLVVLRDFVDGETAPSFETVRTSFEKIWGSIQKPEAFEETSIDVVFELRFQVLPHYRLQRPDFDSAVSEFREWFGSPGNSNYLFRSPNMLRGVPVDGIPSYLSNCWSTIRSSKDLDIPTQRDMLARHRCMDAKTATVDEFKKVCEEYSKRAQQGDAIPEFTSSLGAAIEKLLEGYRLQTKLYKVVVAQEMEEALHGELNDMQLQLVMQYAKSIAVVVLASLDGVIGRGVDDAIRFLQNEARSSLLVESKDAKEVTGGEAASLRSSAGIGGGLIDNNGCRMLAEAFWGKICLSLQAAFRGLGACSSLDDCSATSLYGKFSSVVMDDETLKEGVAHAVLEATQHKLHNRFVAMAENAAETIHMVFEQVLTSKPDGTVRFFRTTEGLLGAERQARVAGLALLGCLVYYRLKLVRGEANDDDNEGKVTVPICLRLTRCRPRFEVCDTETEQKFFLQFRGISDVPRYPLDVPVTVTTGGSAPDGAVDADNVLLSQIAVQRAFDLYKQKSDFTLQLQLRNIESGKQSLPPWVFPVLLLLGWNELYYFLTSPILFITTIVVAVMFFGNFLKSQLEMLEERCPMWLVVPLKTLLGQIQSLRTAQTPSGIASEATAGARLRDPGQATALSGPGTTGNRPSSSSALSSTAGGTRGKDKAE